MQTSLTATLIENQPGYSNIFELLNKTVVLHSTIQRKLYSDIIKYYKKNNTNKLQKSMN